MDCIGYRLSGELSDITVIVDGEEFNLHKFPLFVRSNYFKTLTNLTDTKSPKQRVVLENFPGGARTFEIIADYCYNKEVDVNLNNVVSVKCAAEYLDMTGGSGRGGLVMLADNVLFDLIYSAKAKRDFYLPLVILEKCIQYKNLAQSSGLANKLIDSVVENLKSFLKSNAIYDSIESEPKKSKKKRISLSDDSLRILNSLPLNWMNELVKSAARIGLNQDILSVIIENYIDFNTGLNPHNQNKSESNASNLIAITSSIIKVDQKMNEFVEQEVKSDNLKDIAASILNNEEPKNLINIASDILEPKTDNLKSIAGDVLNPTNNLKSIASDILDPKINNLKSIAGDILTPADNLKSIAGDILAPKTDNLKSIAGDILLNEEPKNLISIASQVLDSTPSNNLKEIAGDILNEKPNNLVNIAGDILHKEEPKNLINIAADILEPKTDNLKTIASDIILPKTDNLASIAGAILNRPKLNNDEKLNIIETLTRTLNELRVEPEFSISWLMIYLNILHELKADTSVRAAFNSWTWNAINDLKSNSTELSSVPVSVMRELSKDISQRESVKSDKLINLVDKYLFELNKENRLNADTFIEVASAVPKEKRTSFDLLANIVLDLLRKENHNINADKQKVLLELIDFGKLNEDSLKKCQECEFVPQKYVTKAALNLCAKLRKELDEAKVLIRSLEPKTSRTNKIDIEPAYVSKYSVSSPRYAQIPIKNEDKSTTIEKKYTGAQTSRSTYSTSYSTPLSSLHYSYPKYMSSSPSLEKSKRDYTKSSSSSSSKNNYPSSNVYRHRHHHHYDFLDDRIFDEIDSVDYLDDSDTTVYTSTYYGYSSRIY